MPFHIQVANPPVLPRITDVSPACFVRRLPLLVNEERLRSVAARSPEDAIPK